MEGRKAGSIALIAVIVIIGLGYVFVSNRGGEVIVDDQPENISQPQEMEETPSEGEVVEEPENTPTTTDPTPQIEEEPESEVDVVYQTDNLAAPSWVPSGVNHPPWEGSIYLATSSDGQSFSDERFFVQHAGVPNLLLTKDNKTIATFQYFSYEDEDLFESIAYTVSDDFGVTWSPVRAIKLGPRYNKGSSPVDPTLVQLEDGRFRLYYTYHEPGNQYAGLYSSSSPTLDDEFKDEGMQLSTDNMLLDPAVVFFEGNWHHYTVNHGGSGTLHSVSSDGLGFTLQDTIESDYQFLGDAIVDDGKLMFYGTGRGVVLAESDDGYEFTKVKEQVADGADPGVVRLPDGNYLIVYTKVNAP